MIVSCRDLDDIFNPSDGDDDPPPFQETGLIAYWSFDDGTATDNSGNGYDGVINGTTFAINGKEGLGLHFYSEYTSSGSRYNNSYVQLPYINFNEYEEFTISMWVMDELEKGEPGEYYIFFGDESTGWMGIGTLLHYNSYSTLFAVGATSQNSYPYPVAMEYNYENSYVWHHYALVYHNGMFQAYKDGRLINTMKQKLYVSSRFAALGAHSVKRGYYTKNYFNGSLDEVKIFDSALSSSEIQRLMN